MQYHHTALITILSMLVYWATIALVGRARGKYKISAPAVTGHADFERVFRVQQNTVESLVMHLPVMWLFAIYVSDVWASIFGAAWIVGRILYTQGYISEAKKRGPGMMISFAATSIMLLGDLVFVCIAMLK